MCADSVQVLGRQRDRCRLGYTGCRQKVTSGHFLAQKPGGRRRDSPVPSAHRCAGTDPVRLSAPASCLPLASKLFSSWFSQTLPKA